MNPNEKDQESMEIDKLVIELLDPKRFERENIQFDDSVFSPELREMLRLKLQLKINKVATCENDSSDFNQLEKLPKGEIIKELPSEYVIFDLETTGLSCYSDEILEIGAMHILDDKIIDTFQTFVKPNCEIPPEATAVNNITNEMVSDAPSLDVALKLFLAFVCDLPVVGHNISRYDVTMICHYCDITLNTTFLNDIFDTFTLTKSLFNGLQSKSLENLVRLFKIDVSDKHRALSDCESIFELIKILKEFCGNDCLSLDFTRTKPKKKNFHSFQQKRVTADLLPNTTKFDESHLFYGKTVIFTNDLIKYSRQEASQLVVNKGGIIPRSDCITKKTDFLVVGDSNDNVTTKQNRAFDLGTKIIYANEFYDLIK